MPGSESVAGVPAPATTPAPIDHEAQRTGAITTAGDDRAGICYEVRSYVVDILDKKIPDTPEAQAAADTVFGVIYTIDDDDWATPEAWRKANPNWGVSVPPQEIANKAHKAIQLASAMAIKDELGEREYEARAAGVPAEKAAGIATQIARDRIDQEAHETAVDDPKSQPA